MGSGSLLLHHENVHLGVPPGEEQLRLRALLRLDGLALKAVHVHLKQLHYREDNVEGLGDEKLDFRMVTPVTFSAEV